MEIQVATPMESKEILTLPRIVPVQRSIGTPLSPIPSKIEARIEKGLMTALRSSTELMQRSCKSIQVKLPLDIALKTSSSTFDLRYSKYINNTKGRSRSEEQLCNVKKSIPHAILSLLEDINNNTDVNKIFTQLKRSIYKKKNICLSCKHIFDDFDILRRSVSNNTYFHDDFQFKIDQQQTSKQFKEKSRPDHINRGDLLNKNKCIQHQLEKHPKMFTHSENRKNARTLTDDNVVISKKVVERKRWLGDCHLSRTNKDDSEDLVDGVNYSNKILAMNGEEIRNLIDLDILAFTEKYRINITTESLNELIEELLDLFVTDLKSISFPNKKLMAEKIKKILRNRGISEYQSIYLTNILTDHWEEDFVTSTSLRSNPSNFRSETFIVLPNITQDSSQYTNSNKNQNYSINEISQKDIDANVELYVSQISNEINEWLSHLQIPQAQDKEVQQSIIHYLATDIVDRHKYLELNPSSQISETSELQHLKYQIFKLISQFGISDMSLVDHATDLMRRIESIPVPTFSIQERKLGAEIPGQSYHRLKVIEPSNLGASSSRRLINLGSKCCNRPTCKRNLNMEGTSKFSSGGKVHLREPGQSYQNTASTKKMSNIKLTSNTEFTEIGETPQPLPRKSGTTDSRTNAPLKYPRGTPCSSCSLFSGGIIIRDDDDENEKNKNIIHGSTHTNTEINESNINEINRGYTQYLKDWIGKIPLPMTSAEDQIATKTARADIYNGILETVSKLRSEPDIFNNRFLFEDMLDDEIEKLMSELPQSPELNSKKHILKVKLIEKTTDTNELLRASSARSYKQQLVENIKSNLPEPMPSENEDPDVLEIYEKLQILNLVEDFIICSHYQNTDPVIGETYRRKLVKRTEDFVEELKANHNKALMNINTKLYLNDILDMLKNVPLPSETTIQEEADEVLLSIEIDKWFSELPLLQTHDFVDQLHRKILRNNLAKQIREVERSTSNTYGVLDNAIKHEILQFLGKSTLQQGQNVNINAMVDELVKRLKNRPTSIGNDTKKVAFDEPDYEEFSRNMPLCSTYTGDPRPNIDTPKRSILSGKTIQAVDPSQLSRSEQYHNISKPLLDELSSDENCCKRDLSVKEVSNYEMFDKTRPRSSSIKDCLETQWYTLPESTQEYPQSNISLNNIRNQSRKEQSNKSIQTISSDQSHCRQNYNIAKPLLDDLRLDSNCCKNEQSDSDTHNAAHPSDCSLRNSTEPNWYTLQESKLGSLSRNSQSRNGTLRFIRGEQPIIPEKCEFNVPQRYLENTDATDFDELRRSKGVSYPKSSPKRTSVIQNEDVGRRNNNHMNNQRWPDSGFSPNRYGSPRLSQRGVTLDQAPIPQRTQYHPTSPEPNRHISNHSPGFEDVIQETRSHSPQWNPSDVYYKSTDKDGIRQTIERNKSIDANLDDISPPEYLSGQYQPSVLIPPGYILYRKDTKKGGYFPNRYEEDSEEENDDEHEIRCLCEEKMRKNKIKYRRYCPFEPYDGYPMCLTSPYFYPYFY